MGIEWRFFYSHDIEDEIKDVFNGLINFEDIKSELEKHSTSNMPILSSEDDDAEEREDIYWVMNENIGAKERGNGKFEVKIRNLMTRSPQQEGNEEEYIKGVESWSKQKLGKLKNLEKKGKEKLRNALAQVDLLNDDILSQIVNPVKISVEKNRRRLTDGTLTIEQTSLKTKKIGDETTKIWHSFAVESKDDIEHICSFLSKTEIGKKMHLISKYQEMNKVLCTGYPAWIVHVASL